MAKDITVTGLAGGRPFTVVAIAIDGFLPARDVPRPDSYQDTVNLKSKDFKDRNPAPRLKTADNLGILNDSGQSQQDLERIRTATGMWKLLVPTRRTSDERSIWQDIDRHDVISEKHVDRAYGLMLDRIKRDQERAEEKGDHKEAAD